MREGRAEMRKRKEFWSEEALEATLEGAPDHDEHLLRRATKTGAWLKVQLSTVNET